MVDGVGAARALALSTSRSRRWMNPDADAIQIGNTPTFGSCPPGATLYL